MSLLDLSPREFAQELARQGGRACVTTAPGGSGPVSSAPWMEELAVFLRGDERDYQAHEGLFFAVGEETGALFGAFVHATKRGQGAGGLRHWPYGRLEDFVRDGLRLSLGMSRKNALAGLWWGGGKGIIARQDEVDFRDPEYRRRLFREYGRFVTSLNGVYVTAEDVGTTPTDVATVFETSRHVTCVPPSVGGSGNPSQATALGVACAIEAALEFHGEGPVKGRRFVLQGAGNVAGFLIERLLELGAGSILASDISEDRCAAMRDRFADAPVEVRSVERGDDSILAEEGDVLAPCALGGSLGPKSIPGIRTPIVCGAANNQLLDDRRDDAALAERGLLYVPDFVANRMGIVNCANEQYGSLRKDPAIHRHFDRSWEHGVHAVTTKVLEHSRDGGVTTSQAANTLADEAIQELHPIWGHRGWDLVDDLLQGAWAADS
jgi:glutamate dehydrogenase/leucine dehydrogenase